MEKNLIKTCLFLAVSFILLLPASALAGLQSDSGGTYYRDPMSGDKYYDYPPLELLKGKSSNQISDALKQWNVGVESYLKAAIKNYYECKAVLEDSNRKLDESKQKREEVEKKYEAAVKLLKRNLVAVLVRLSLQTGAVIIDGTTDAYILGKSIKESIVQEQAKTKQAKARAEMLAQFELLTTRAARARHAAMAQRQALAALRAELRAAEASARRATSDDGSQNPRTETASRTPDQPTNPRTGDRPQTKTPDSGGPPGRRPDPEGSRPPRDDPGGSPRVASVQNSTRGFNSNIDRATRAALDDFASGNLGRSVRNYSIDGKSFRQIDSELAGPGGWIKNQQTGKMVSSDGRWTRTEEIKTSLPDGTPTQPYRQVYYENIDGGVVRLKPDGMPGARFDRQKVPHGTMYVKKNRNAGTGWDNEAFKVHEGTALPREPAHVDPPAGMNMGDYLDNVWGPATHRPLQ